MAAADPPDLSEGLIEKETAYHRNLPYISTIIAQNSLKFKISFMFFLKIERSAYAGAFRRSFLDDDRRAPERGSGNGLPADAAGWRTINFKE